MATVLAEQSVLGARDMNLAQVCQEQRRLAYRAPATALAANMHVYWTLGILGEEPRW